MLRNFNANGPNSQIQIHLENGSICSPDGNAGSRGKQIHYMDSLSSHLHDRLLRSVIMATQRSDRHFACTYFEPEDLLSHHQVQKLSLKRRFGAAAST